MTVRRPKKYKCIEAGCSKAYSRPCLLEQHQRSHSDVRPFECDVCDKKFLRDSHLQSHRWTHSKEKPLGCDKCDKRFITNQQLKRHLQTHIKREVKVKLEEEEEVEVKEGIQDLWKLQLDKMTKEIDSLVYDSPIDQVPSIDISSFGLSPEYVYDMKTEVLDTDLEQKCPYSCSSSFTSVTDLSLHMLSCHILCEDIDHSVFLDKTDGDYPQFDQFINEFIHIPHQEHEDERPTGVPVGVPIDHGVPEMRYQRTFGSSEGHRVTVRAIGESDYEIYDNMERYL